MFFIPTKVRRRLVFIYIPKYDNLLLCIEFTFSLILQFLSRLFRVHESHKYFTKKSP